MTDETEAPEAPRVLPAEAIDAVDELTEPQLRALVDYARERQKFLHEAIADQIEPGPGEEIVRIKERQGYTEVVKREPCGEDECSECPHGPYLYHVIEEKRPDGDRSLHWRYLGEVDE